MSRWALAGLLAAARERRVDGTARGRHQGALDGDLRPSQSPDGGDDLQQRCRGLLGVGGQSELSGEVLGAGNPAGRELRGLLDDALSRSLTVAAPIRARHFHTEHATVRERYGFGVVSGTGKVREPMAPDARS